MSTLKSSFIFETSVGGLKAATHRNTKSTRDENMNVNRILLVDDNIDFLEVSHEFLDAMDDLLVVGTATSGEEALTLLDQVTPSTIITDLVMPGMSGLELTSYIKHRLPTVRVIVMTMHDTAHHRQAAIAAGADAFITKARMVSDLEPAIREALH